MEKTHEFRRFARIGSTNLLLISWDKASGYPILSDAITDTGICKFCGFFPFTYTSLAFLPRYCLVLSACRYYILLYCLPNLGEQKSGDKIPFQGAECYILVSVLGTVRPWRNLVFLLFGAWWRMASYWPCDRVSFLALMIVEVVHFTYHIWWCLKIHTVFLTRQCIQQCLLLYVGACLNTWKWLLKSRSSPIADSTQTSFVFSAIVEDDDEILLALAEALGQLVPAVGGPGHSVLLLPR